MLIHKCLDQYILDQEIWTSTKPYRAQACKRLKICLYRLIFLLSYSDRNTTAWAFIIHKFWYKSCLHLLPLRDSFSIQQYVSATDLITEIRGVYKWSKNSYKRREIDKFNSNCTELFRRKLQMYSCCHGNLTSTANWLLYK